MSCSNIYYFLSGFGGETIYLVTEDTSVSTYPFGINFNLK